VPARAVLAGTVDALQYNEEAVTPIGVVGSMLASLTCEPGATFSCFVKFIVVFPRNLA